MESSLFHQQEEGFQANGWSNRGHVLLYSAMILHRGEKRDRHMEGDANVSQHSSDQEALLLGEETASLFHRYGRALFAYVRLHELSREDCKDITLEVFQIALRYDDLTQISEEERFTWLRRVASHKIVDRRRRTMRHPEITLEAVAEILFTAESSDPESIVLQEEAHLRLRHLIRRLPVQEQQLLRLRYGDRLSFAQIGQLLERKETAVRKHHSRILARLRTLYEPKKGV